jgi:hypothetical protein
VSARAGAAIALVCVLVALAPAGAYVARAPREIAAEADRTYPESVVAWNAAELRAGRPLYRDWRREPHVIAPYTPLGYALDAALSDGTPHGARLAGRTISVVAALAIAALLAAIAARLSPSPRAAAALAVAFFLGSALLVPYGWSARPDLLAASLSLVAVVLGCGLLGKSRPVLAAVVALLGVLAKQSAVAAPAAILLVHLARRKPRVSLAFLATFALGLAASIGSLLVATHGEFFRNVVVGNAAPLSASHVWKTGGKALLAGLAGVPFVLALGALPRGDAKRRALAAWGAIALGVGLLSLAKTGSDENYLIEASAPAAVLAAIAIVGTGERLALRTAAAAAWGVVALLGSGEGDAAPSDARARALAALREAPDPVWVQPPDLAVECGKPVVMLDAYNFELLEAAGVFDPGALADRIRRGEIASALLDFDPSAEAGEPTYQGAPRVSPALVAVWREGWRVSARYGRYVMLVPTNRAAK